MRPFVPSLLAALAVLALGTSVANAAVDFDWATVGDVGNAADPLNSASVPGIGSVATEYRIATKEVNLLQYTEFLNAVDPNGLNSLALYNASMSSNANIAGIAFNNGASAGSKYSVMGSGLRPVTYVSWNDSARFVNWLENGQGSGSTETGVYDMSLGTPTRSGSASYWIPSENEWYKAAYYQPVGQGGDTDSYWLYPTKSNTAPGNVIGAGANQANMRNGAYEFSVTQSGSYSDSQNYLTDGGAFSGSESYYGTSDQGGNVYKWNDTVFGSLRGLRGGSWSSVENNLRSSGRLSNSPALEESGVGFRVASVPEPSTAMLMMLGGAALLPRKRRRTPL